MSSLTTIPHDPVRPGLARDRRAADRRSGRFALDRAAVRDILPVTISVMPFAAVLGVTIAQAASVPVWVGLLSGPLLYGGSAQLTTLTLLDSGAGMVTVLATVAIVNARLSMYGAALEPRFRDQPGWFRWLAPHSLVDQTYALADARAGLSGAGFRRYWITAGVVLLIGWMGAMAITTALAPLIPQHSPLEFASTAIFVGLLIPRVRRRRARPAALVAAAVALLAAPLPYGLGVLVAVLAGIVTGMVRDTVLDRRQR